MGVHGCELVIVEPGAPELPILHREAERLDEMKPAAGVRCQANDISGVGRDLGLNEDDVEHQDGGSVRATTQFTTRAAPARLRVCAISSRVAPVVMTSSTTATVAPPSGLRQEKAPRTLLRRSSQGSPICGAPSISRTHASTSSLPRATCRAISTDWL